MNLAEIRKLTTITVEQAAAALGLSKNATYELVRSGEIEARKFGRRVVIPVPQFLALLGIDAEHHAPPDQQRRIA